ncbi:MAG: hypothetical protein EGQ64_06580 [Ruminococcaceae bacterium]|nr:hypothetical protein [Oscillospiraceae bacterium]
MKMLKKAAAVLLAAAMSLVMLTACGGGSGSTTQYKLAKIVSESQKTGQMNMDVVAPVGANGANVRVRSASNGEKQVIFMGREDGVGYWLMKANNTVYTLQESENREDKPIWVKPEGDMAINLAKQASSVVPSQSSLSNIKVNPEYEVKDKGTYYAEIVTSEGQEVAYCFKGDAVKYMVITTNKQTVVAEVKDFSAKLPEDVTFLFDLKVVG